MNSDSDNSSEAEQFTYKTITAPEARGYTVQREDTYRGRGCDWTITHPDMVDERGLPVHLATFEIHRSDPSRIQIPSAYTGNDTRPKEQRLALRDLLLGIWKFHAGREPSSLRQISYMIVEEDGLKALIPKIYRLLGQPDETPLIVERYGSRPGEKEAFALLMEEAAFCIGAGKMLKEYAEFSALGTECQAFEFTNDPHFNIHFGIKLPEVSFPPPQITDIS